MPLLRRTTIIGLVVLAALALVGCRGLVGNRQAPADPSPAADARATATPEPSPECFGADVSVSHAPYTIETVTGFSKTVLAGTVRALEGGVWNTPNEKQPANGQRSGPRFNPEILTPINVNIEEVLAGDPSPGTIRLLNEGGTAGCSVVNVPSAPVIEKGARYVFFLRDGEDTDGRKRGDLEVIITAWPIDANGNVTTEQDGVVPLEEVTARVAAAAPGGGPGGASGSAATAAPEGMKVPAPTPSPGSSLPMCAGASWPPLPLEPVPGVDVSMPDQVTIVLANGAGRTLYYRVEGWPLEANGSCLEYASNEYESGPITAGSTITSAVGRLVAPGTYEPYSVAFWAEPCGEGCASVPIGVVLIGG